MRSAILLLLALSFGSSAFALNGDCTKEAVAEALRRSVRTQSATVDFEGTLSFQYQINQSNADETDIEVTLNGKEFFLKVRDVNACTFRSDEPLAIGSKVVMTETFELRAQGSLNSPKTGSRLSRGYDAIIIGGTTDWFKVQRGNIVGWVPENVVTAY